MLPFFQQIGSIGHHIFRISPIVSILFNDVFTKWKGNHKGCNTWEIDICGQCYGDGTSCLIPGDINGDEILNVVDIVALVNMILAGEYNPIADLNEDGIVNVVDIVAMVNIILEQ